MLGRGVKIPPASNASNDSGGQGTPGAGRRLTRHGSVYLTTSVAKELNSQYERTARTTATEQRPGTRVPGSTA